MGKPVVLVRVAATVLFVLLAGCSSLQGRSVSDRAQTLELGGAEAYDLGHYETARSRWEEALALVRERGDDAASARLLVGLAQVDESSGRYPQALARSAEGLALAQSLHDEPLEARARVTFAQACRQSGRYAEAQRQLDRALEMARQLQSPQLEVDAVRTAGAVQQARGDYQSALLDYERSLALARQIGDEPGEAKALNNLGGVHRLQGQYPQALRFYEASLALRRRLDDLGGEGKVLGNLCLLYQNLRDFARARDLCSESLRIAHQVGDQAREANNLNSLGSIYRRLGQNKKALSRYRRSMEIKRALGDRAGEARALNNIGELYWQKGRPEQAAEFLARSLAIKEELGDRPGQSATHYNLGALYLSLGEHEKALLHFQQTLELEMEMGEQELLWRAFDGLSRAHAALGRRDLAILLGKQAVNVIQIVRADIRKLDESLQRSYIQDKERVYRTLADLLLDAGRLLEAQQVLAMLKEEQYFDFIRGDSDEDPRTTRASYSRSEAAWVERFRKISPDLARLGREYATLQEKDPAELDESERARLAELEADLDIAATAFEQYLEDLQDAFAAAGGRRAVEFGKKDLESLTGFQDILRDLDHSAVLVHFVFTPDDRLEMMVTGPDPMLPPILREAPVAKAELTRLIYAYREKLQDPTADPLPEAQALYQDVIAPIEPDLEALGARVLMVYLDEALRYVPLPALHDGSRYLAERYAVVMYTVAAKGALKDPPAPEWSAAGFGVSQPAEGFGPLPAVPEELDAIVKEGETDAAGVLPGRVYMDAAFTADQLRQTLSNGYTVVHLATHFSFRPGTAEDSFLLLGGGVHLSLADLKRRRYPFAGVELLTLSACDTALGGDDADGREIEGFGALAQNRGAKAVLATLWEVADRSTALFMEQLYARRQQRRETKVEALRQTQLAFLHGATSGIDNGEAAGRGQVIAPSRPLDRSGAGAPYAHPYYWAPFILMGNWL